MAWRKPVTSDLIAVMSSREVDAYRRSSEITDDPATALAAQAAGVLRSHLRRGGVRMSPRDGEIPEELMGPCMDYAAYSLCKRISVQVSDEREQAWRAALDMFRAVAERKLEPEGYTDPDTASGGRTQPLVTDPGETAILG